MGLLAMLRRVSVVLQKCAPRAPCSDNSFSEFQLPEAATDLPPFPRLEWLSLAGNLLPATLDVAALAQAPMLSKVLLTRNPCSEVCPQQEGGVGSLTLDVQSHRLAAGLYRRPQDDAVDEKEPDAPRQPPSPHRRRPLSALVRALGDTRTAAVLVPKPPAPSPRHISFILRDRVAATTATAAATVAVAEEQPARSSLASRGVLGGDRYYCAPPLAAPPSIVDAESSGFRERSFDGGEAPAPSHSRDVCFKPDAAPPPSSRVMHRFAKASSESLSAGFGAGPLAPVLPPVCAPDRAPRQVVMPQAPLRPPPPISMVVPPGMRLDVVGFEREQRRAATARTQQGQPRGESAAASPAPPLPAMRLGLGAFQMPPAVAALSAMPGRSFGLETRREHAAAVLAAVAAAPLPEALLKAATLCAPPAAPSSGGGDGTWEQQGRSSPSAGRASPPVIPPRGAPLIPPRDRARALSVLGGVGAVAAGPPDTQGHVRQSGSRLRSGRASAAARRRGGQPLILERSGGGGLQREASAALESWGPGAVLCSSSGSFAALTRGVESSASPQSALIAWDPSVNDSAAPSLVLPSPSSSTHVLSHSKSRGSLASPGGPPAALQVSLERGVAKGEAPPRQQPDPQHEQQQDSQTQRQQQPLGGLPESSSTTAAAVDAEQSFSALSNLRLALTLPPQRQRKSKSWNAAIAVHPTSTSNEPTVEIPSLSAALSPSLALSPPSPSSPEALPPPELEASEAASPARSSSSSGGLGASNGSDLEGEDGVGEGWGRGDGDDDEGGRKKEPDKGRPQSRGLASARGTHAAAAAVRAASASDASRRSGSASGARRAATAGPPGASSSSRASSAGGGGRTRLGGATAVQRDERAGLSWADLQAKAHAGGGGAVVAGNSDVRETVDKDPSRSAAEKSPAGTSALPEAFVAQQQQQQPLVDTPCAASSAAAAPSDPAAAPSMRGEASARPASTRRSGRVSVLAASQSHDRADRRGPALAALLPEPLHAGEVWDGGAFRGGSASLVQKEGLAWAMKAAFATAAPRALPCAAAPSAHKLRPAEFSEAAAAQQQPQYRRALSDLRHFLLRSTEPSILPTLRSPRRVTDAGSNETNPRLETVQSDAEKGAAMEGIVAFPPASRVIARLPDLQLRDGGARDYSLKTRVSGSTPHAAAPPAFSSARSHQAVQTRAESSAAARVPPQHHVRKMKNASARAPVVASHPVPSLQAATAEAEESIAAIALLLRAIT